MQILTEKLFWNVVDKGGNLWEQVRS